MIKGFKSSFSIKQSAVVLYVLSLAVGAVLLGSCHLLDRSLGKEDESQKFSKAEVSNRGIAAVGPSAEFGKALKGSGSVRGDRRGEEPDLGFLSFQFRFIGAGSFDMGSPKGEAYREENENGRDGYPVRVEISKAFEIMTKEVTQKQWYLVMKDHRSKRLRNPSYFSNSKYCENYISVKGVGMCPEHPVEQVSWDEVQEYIKRLNHSRGLRNCRGTPRDPRGCYRLPTEAEWEYAVRAGKKTAYFFSNSSSSLGRYAWYGRNSGGRTHEAGTRAVSPWGLYDVYGNVWEWVQDGYKDYLIGGKDPLVATGSGRVLRGGSWYDGAEDLRSAGRHGDHPGHGYLDIGFRLVRTL